MSATDRYIAKLIDLKAGDLGLLRTHVGQQLDESLEGFDLFTGLWWPLRQQDPTTPRREVSWLIAKLYAVAPIPHLAGDSLASQMRRCMPVEDISRKSYQSRFDELLASPLNQIESALNWATHVVAKQRRTLDWVKLTDDLSRWEREHVRLKWAHEFLKETERGIAC